jgi:hypothetical protein
MLARHGGRPIAGLTRGGTTRLDRAEGSWLRPRGRS